MEAADALSQSARTSRSSNDDDKPPSASLPQSKRRTTRAPPSGANPENLVGGQEVNNEVDVLHIEDLPTFGGRLCTRPGARILDIARGALASRPGLAGTA